MLYLWSFYYCAFSALLFVAKCNWITKTNVINTEKYPHVGYVLRQYGWLIKQRSCRRRQAVQFTFNLECEEMTPRVILTLVFPSAKNRKLRTYSYIKSVLYFTWSNAKWLVSINGSYETRMVLSLKTTSGTS